MILRAGRTSVPSHETGVRGGIENERSSKSKLDYPRPMSMGIDLYPSNLGVALLVNCESFE